MNIFFRVIYVRSEILIPSIFFSLVYQDDFPIMEIIYENVFIIRVSHINENNFEEKIIFVFVYIVNKNISHSICVYLLSIITLKRAPPCIIVPRPKKCLHIHIHTRCENRTGHVFFSFKKLLLIILICFFFRIYMLNSHNCYQFIKWE